MKRILLLALALLPVSCVKNTPDIIEPETEEYSTRTYANIFGYNIMRTYYLWSDEVSDDLRKWTMDEDPIEKVASLRYKDADGNLVDRWTELMDDYSSFQSSVTGSGKTFGMDFMLLANGEQGVVMEITYTYASSPARKAGLKRGDIIMSIDGEALTRSNYVQVLTEKIYNDPQTVTLGLYHGEKVQLTAVKMYSDPVLVAETLNAGGKKVGYLHFTNFTLDACIQLVEAFRQFKADGIEDLILDLRYNTGGYSQTAVVLASMIAPPDVVKAGKVFNKEVYNSLLADSMSEETCFQDSFIIDFSSGRKSLNTFEVNPDIKHLYAITSGYSASASESLLCGLIPYMDVTLVGSTTYGKFCGGYLILASDFYDLIAKEEDIDLDCADGKAKTASWGIYVIASRYADCNGVTLSMPSGIPADVEVHDNPGDGFQLGDPSESMLSVALGLASGSAVASSPATKSVTGTRLPFQKPGYGVLLY